MKPRFAIRTFNQSFFAAYRYDRNDKKQRDKIHPRFFGKLRECAAIATTNSFRCFRRTPSERFCADDKKHISEEFYSIRFQIHKEVFNFSV